MKLGNIGFIMVHGVNEVRNEKNEMSIFIQYKKITEVVAPHWANISLMV